MLERQVRRNEFCSFLLKFLMRLCPQLPAYNSEAARISIVLWLQSICTWTKHVAKPRLLLIVALIAAELQTKLQWIQNPDNDETL
jgi:hypothetical protein